MKRLLLGCVMAVLVAASASAQVETKTDTKVKVKDGKEVQMTGCVEVAASGPAAYMLTNAMTNGKNGATVHNYYLVGDTGSLKNHVGHMMEIKGKAVDRSDGKLVVESKTKVEREHADDSKSKGKTEVKGDLNGAPLPFLEVGSVKMLRASCNVS